MDLSSRDRDGLAGRLRIGALESTASTRLPPLVADYHARWPRVELEISLGTSASLTDGVHDGRIDCAFVARPEPASTVSSNETCREAGANDGLAATYAYTEELLLVLPPSHPHVRAVDDLTIAAIAVFAEGCTYRRVLERWLASTAGDNAHARHWDVVEQTSYHGILTSVAAGCCIALCPRSVLEAQQTMPYVRTHSLGMVDTFLIAREGFMSAAYVEFVHALRRTGHAFRPRYRRPAVSAESEANVRPRYTTSYLNPDKGEANE
ncbi:DNA-binding transcriptional LysR family regulator [Trinickia symbiotica]|nr:LysR substrate-binding domain-containing protein [Trinickia symbiotica]PPK47214.1 DNA-binding transcriptional LysR family regulator [Trinickia symbiotica]